MTSQYNKSPNIEENIEEKPLGYNKTKYIFNPGQKVIVSSRNHPKLEYGDQYTVLECFEEYRTQYVRLAEFGPNTRFIARRFIPVLANIPHDAAIPQETEGDEIFNIKITSKPTAGSIFCDEPAAPADPIEDWHDRAKAKAYHRNPKFEQTDAPDPDPEPKNGPDLTGIERAKDAKNRDGLILAAVRGTEVKS